MKTEKNFSSSFLIPNSSLPKAVAHFNIFGFKAAAAAVKDKSLLGRPYVIAGGNSRGNYSGRSLALDCSPEAVRQGINPGMALVAAQRRVPDLLVLPPDLSAYEKMNKELDRLAAQYAPVWENDRSGNLYLDITGTTRMFGPPVDCSSRILKDILEQLDIRPAAAVACNKLVSKVGTRTIRPTGLIQIHAETEAEFLAHQDIRILPGMGPKLLRTAAITGIRAIGELAALAPHQALALFGKQGALLRDRALGIDNTPVENRRGARRINQQADFNEYLIDEEIIFGSIGTLAENGGLEMRNDKLGSRCVKLGVIYSDGVELEGCKKTKNLMITDNDIYREACALYGNTATRRIRIRSIYLCLEDFSPLGFQPDLFEPEIEITGIKLQEAIDKIQNRYGIGKITRGRCLKSASMPILGNVVRQLG
jgi:DNA polymerase-4